MYNIFSRRHKREGDRVFSCRPWRHPRPWMVSVISGDKRLIVRNLLLTQNRVNELQIQLYLYYNTIMY